MVHRRLDKCDLALVLDRPQREKGFLDLVVDNPRFDIGLPEYYLKTLRVFSRG